MFRLAHLSDIHLGPLPELSLRELASKRVTGYVNWQRNRRRAMFGDTLTNLVQDLHDEAPDHTVVTGDLVNLATKTETIAARLWLEMLGKPDQISVVPGNHDAYVPGALRRSLAEWHEYLVRDGSTEGSGVVFPYVRVRDCVAVFGVSTAEATAPFFATGTFSRRQAMTLARQLEESRIAGQFRVVLIHHPPIEGATAWHKRMHGRELFAKIIREVGAELILHGHTHLDTLYWLDGPDGQVPVVGVPSASQAPGGINPASRYNLFEISGAPGEWSLIQRERGARIDVEGIGWIRQRELLSDGTAVNVESREDAPPAM